jgi:hypothetical protein
MPARQNNLIELKNFIMGPESDVVAVRPTMSKIIPFYHPLG